MRLSVRKPHTKKEKKKEPQLKKKEKNNENMGLVIEGIWGVRAI